MNAFWMDGRVLAPRGSRCVSIPQSWHLYLGDHEQNMADKVRAGEHRGSNASNAILNESQVQQIRTRYAGGGTTQAALAAEHGVSESAIRAVLHRQTWAHVTDREVAS